MDFGWIPEVELSAVDFTLPEDPSSTILLIPYLRIKLETSKFVSD